MNRINLRAIGGMLADCCKRGPKFSFVSNFLIRIELFKPSQETVRNIFTEVISKRLVQFFSGQSEQFSYFGGAYPAFRKV